MGRKTRGIIHRTLMVVNDRVVRYCINSRHPVVHTLDPPLTRDRFHEMLKQASNNTEQTTNKAQQNSTDAHSETAQYSGEIQHQRELILNRPDFETRQVESYETRQMEPYEARQVESYAPRPAAFYESTDSEDEDSCLIKFDTRSIMEDFSILDGSIATYDPTALYTRNCFEH